MTCLFHWPKFASNDHQEQAATKKHAPHGSPQNASGGNLCVCLLQHGHQTDVCQRHPSGSRVIQTETQMWFRRRLCRTASDMKDVASFSTPAMTSTGIDRPHECSNWTRRSLSQMFTNFRTVLLLSVIKSQGIRIVRTTKDCILWRTQKSFTKRFRGGGRVLPGPSDGWKM